MAHPEQAQGGPEEQGPHGRLVVGTEHLRSAESIEDFEKLPQQGHCASAFDRFELETGPGAVVKDAENRFRLPVGAGYPGPVEGPDDVSSQRTGPPVLDLSPETKHGLPVVAERTGDEGLAYGHPASHPVEAVEGQGDPSAACLGHERLQPEDLAAHPGGLRRMDSGWGRCRWLAGASR